MKLHTLHARLQELEFVTNGTNPEVRVGVDGDARPLASVGCAIHYSGFETVAAAGDALADGVMVVIFEPGAADDAADQPREMLEDIYHIEATYHGTPADVARRADADANPWGEPGDIIGGAVWVMVPWLSDPTSAFVERHPAGDPRLRSCVKIGSRSYEIELAKREGWRFRHRPIPLAPLSE